MMHSSNIIFYVFTFILIFSSILVVFAKNPVHSVLFLVLCFFASAALWLFLEAEFLALILVLVYVGAVMTLFLFVVMMLNLDVIPKRKHFWRYFSTAFVITSLFLIILISGIIQQKFSLGLSTDILAKSAQVSNINALGEVLYTDYFLPFQMAALILLVAMISAIMLTLRPSTSKKQDIAKQIRTERRRNVRLINVDNKPTLGKTQT